MSDLQLLVDEIQSRRRARVLGSQRKSRQEHPRASSIGNCPREVYYQITEWELKPEPDAELLHRFQRGTDVEVVVKRELMLDGWEVVESQMPFAITETVNEKDLIICTGHTDGRLAKNGLKPVLEIKSLNPNVWNRIERFDDFDKLGGWWAKYPRQLLLYCYKFNEPHGMFLLDDCLGHWRLLPVELEAHLDECEVALGIAKTAAVAAAKHEPPEFIDDPRECRRCWAREARVCFPPLDCSDEGVRILDDQEIAANLHRIEELREAATEYIGLEKAVKSRMKAGSAGRFLAGDFLVTVKDRGRKAYNVPDEVKRQYLVEGQTSRYVTWAQIADEAPP